MLVNNMKKIFNKKVLIKFIFLDSLFLFLFIFMFYGPWSGFRNFWITSSMTTMSHQYLATSFYTDDVIQKVLQDNSIIEKEGPHACTGELSMGKVLGFLDESRIKEHGNFIKNPEVGMVGLKLARENEPIIDQEAKFIEENGFKIDEEFGKQLLDNAEKKIINDIKSLL